MKHGAVRSWYNLPEEYRESLAKISPHFETIRHQGSWMYPVRGQGYEPETIAVLRKHRTVFYEEMQQFKKMMDDGFLIAIFPRGFCCVDICFYPGKKPKGAPEPKISTTGGT